MGEIDITEAVNGDPIWYGTYHWNANYDKPAPFGKCAVANGKAGHAEVQRCAPLERWDSEYHEYAVEWDGTSTMRFYLNGVLVSSVDAGATAPTRPPDGIERGSAAYFPVYASDPMYLMLQTAIGGGWPGEPFEGWPQGKTTVMPTYHRIDYVRYETRTGTRV